MRYADLHLHTNHSDGSDTPRRVLERAAAIPLAAVAITDHDTVSAYEEAAAAAAELGTEFLSGVEISAQRGRVEVHLLGLGVDPRNEVLAGALLRLRDSRHVRAGEMVERLRNQGILLDLDAVRARASAQAVGRMHVAAELCAHGFTRTVQEGFDRFLNFGRPAYVPKQAVSVEEALAWIHASGGLAFIAHPGLNSALRGELPALLSLAVDGIEAYHVSHSAGETEGFLELARSRGLLVSGGSDCHGTVKGRRPEMGKVRLPWEHYERLRDALAGGHTPRS